MNAKVTTLTGSNISALKQAQEEAGLEVTLTKTTATFPGTAAEAYKALDVAGGTLEGGPQDLSTSFDLMGNSAPGNQSGDRALAAADSENLCFRVSLPLSTGNAYQNSTSTVTLTFNAEQTAHNP